MMRRAVVTKRRSSENAPAEGFDRDREELCLPGCRSFPLVSEINGLPYQIFVFVPDAEAPSTGFPVTYVLDGNSDFVMTVETVRRASRRPGATGINPSIVVGIGYPNTQAYDMERRYFDYTRSGPAGPEEESPAAAYGGQGEFLAFLSRQLMPLIVSRFCGDPCRSTLVGHSLAGYFVLEAMAALPQLFRGHISFSPSIWWDRQGLMTRLRKGVAAQQGLRLYTAAGRYEQDLAPWQPVGKQDANYHALRSSRRMIQNAEEIAAEVQQHLGDSGSVRFEVGEQEDHSTVFAALLCRGLRFVDTGF